MWIMNCSFCCNFVLLHPPNHNLIRLPHRGSKRLTFHEELRSADGHSWTGTEMSRFSFFHFSRKKFTIWIYFYKKAQPKVEKKSSDAWSLLLLSLKWTPSTKKLSAWQNWKAWWGSTPNPRGWGQRATSSPKASKATPHGYRWTSGRKHGFKKSPKKRTFVGPCFFWKKHVNF